MASVQVETVSTGAEKARLAIVVLLVIGALAAFYMLASQGSVAQWGGLLAGLILAAVIFFTSEYGRRLIAFGRDSWREIKKVVWPTRKETLQTTAFVFAFAVTMALFLWLTDKTLEWALYDLILGWRR
ncbi:preprotein translocase subunit SecE [Ottowia testudinis]|uniref:Protein translocase subunit SecE n=1 Tax=Ottowia testudinis TaxID=2816950 RepID=A0A975H3A0_9BURK|nr:preprotein translocase subunit SecE [Ottowia testudinis]QTD45016.1 preprotein translocase subunit SecE [Ottowia testudinis]